MNSFVHEEENYRDWGIYFVLYLLCYCFRKRIGIICCNIKLCFLLFFIILFYNGYDANLLVIFHVSYNHLLKMKFNRAIVV